MGIGIHVTEAHMISKHEWISVIWMFTIMILHDSAMSLELLLDRVAREAENQKVYLVTLMRIILEKS